MTANGRLDDLIATYLFRVKKATTYFVWLDSFALTNATNGVKIQLGDNTEKISRNIIWNKISGLWLPVNFVRGNLLFFFFNLINCYEYVFSSRK